VCGHRPVYIYIYLDILIQLAYGLSSYHRLFFNKSQILFIKKKSNDLVNAVLSLDSYSLFFFFTAGIGDSPTPKVVEVDREYGEFYMLFFNDV